MSYKVIARRYRPSTFTEVAGQQHITQTIAKSIEKGQHAHAYLFSGPHGVGKTSLARIIAKALNCEQGPTSEPCGVCESCKRIATNSALDIIEIDGASNRGIDNMRDIIESVRISPAAGRFKIYIIDEVHQITNEAFNALLKTLEEPPAHVVFILATTEVDKVLPTIKSRCQQFTFKRLVIDDIIGILKHILENEKIDYDEEAVFLIAKHSRGSVRDSETILEKIIAYVGSSGRVTSEKVLDVIGSSNFELIKGIFDAMIKGDKKDFFDVISKMKETGVDPKPFTQNLIEYLRCTILMKAGIDDIRSLEIPSTERDELQGFCSHFSSDELQHIIEYVLDLDYKLRAAVNPMIIFELRGMKLLESSSLISPGELLQAVSEIKVSAVNQSASTGVAADEEEEKTETDAVFPNILLSERNDNKVKFYMKVGETIRNQSALIFGYITQGRPVAKEGATLIITMPSNVLKMLNEDKRSESVITKAISMHTSNPDVKFKFIEQEQYNKENGFSGGVTEKIINMFDGTKIEQADIESKNEEDGESV